MRVRRPEILDSIPSHHAVIEASAGTGKTFTLEHLVVDRIIAGATLEEVLVVTFTEKATREMRGRVRSLLGRLIHDPAEFGPKDSPSAWEIDAAAFARLQAGYLGFERAPISTIHGFCQRVLADHAFRSQRPFSQELVEPRRAFRRAFRDELRVVLASDSSDRAMLLRMLDTLPVDALESALYPWFTERGAVNPGWNEAQFLAALESLVDVASFDAALMSAIPRSDVAERAVAQLRSLQAIAQKFCGPSVRSRGTTAHVISALLAVDAWSQKEVVQGLVARTWVPERVRVVADLHQRIVSLLDVAPPLFGVLVHRLLPRVRTRLNIQKSERGQIDFDDMLTWVDDALRGPGGDALVTTLRRQYRHALVDEFQDTDSTQWSIFSKLFVESGSTGSLTVIGDPKQAIYGFRNADVHTYNRVKEQLAPEGAVRLVDCYRATQRLITAYNTIFEEGFFEGDVRYDQPVRCGEPKRGFLKAGEDTAALCLWQVMGREKPNIADVRQAIARRIALEARALVEGDTSWRETTQARGLRYADLHVLVRNAREADIVADELRRAEIPYSFFKQDGLFQTTQAEDLLALLRAIADPDDRAARTRAWLTAFFEVPLERLDALRDLDALHPLSLMLQQWQRRAERHDPTLLRALLEDSGLVRRLLRSPSGARALTNFEHLIEILLEESGGHRGVRDAIALLEAFIDGRAIPVRGGNVQRTESDRDALQILTMHKSKGLEAIVVFLAGGFSRGGKVDAREPRIVYREDEQGLRSREAWLPPLPADVEAASEQESREEDERLLYVALTRAKGRLYVPYFGAPPASEATRLGEARQRYGPLSGPHRWLDRRLEDLVLGGFVDGDSVTYEAVPTDLPRAEPIPEPKLVSPHEPRAHVDFDGLRDTRRGLVMTSYSRMKSGRVLSTALDDVRPEEFEVDADDESAIAETAQSEAASQLPGGASMGVFLHEVLEHLDRARVRDATDYESWAAHAQGRFVQSARRHGVDERHVDLAQHLIFDALRAPVDSLGLKLPQGLCQIGDACAELELLYPIPEASHPDIGRFGSHPLGRGLIRGILDLVFEHEGRTFVLDWKSDRVRDSPEALRAYVLESYGLQAKLYTLGIVRMMGIDSEEAYEAQFGGLLYCFLRVMPGGRGLVAERPSWAEVVAWDHELRTQPKPFGYPLR